VTQDEGSNEEEGGIYEVELFLDRERPEVLKCRRRLLRS
jgi:hypothetical protein